MIAVSAAGLLSAADARAAGNKEVLDLRRELSRLRAEVQALQSAIAETTELERQRDATIVRALKDDPGASSRPEPSPSDAPAASNEAAGDAREAAPPPPPAPATATIAAGDEKGRATSRRHHHRNAGRSRAKATRVLTNEK
jgi:hypothetical protein